MKEKKRKYEKEDLPLISISAIFGAYFAAKNSIQDGSIVSLIFTTLAGFFLFLFITVLTNYTIEEYLKSKSIEDIKFPLVIMTFVISVFVGFLGFSILGDDREYVLKDKYDDLLYEYEQHLDECEDILLITEENAAEKAGSEAYEYGYEQGWHDGYSKWEIDTDEIYRDAFLEGQSDGYSAGYMDAINGVPTPTPPPITDLHLD